MFLSCDARLYPGASLPPALATGLCNTTRTARVVKKSKLGGTAICAEILQERLACGKLSFCICKVSPTCSSTMNQTRSTNDHHLSNPCAGRYYSRERNCGIKGMAYVGTVLRSNIRRVGNYRSAEICRMLKNPFTGGGALELKHCN